MEEDEEELYSEMQLEDGGRRRPSGTSHNALKVSTELMTGCPKSGGCSIMPFHWDYSMGAVRNYLLLLSALPRRLGTGVWGIHLEPLHTASTVLGIELQVAEVAAGLTCSDSSSSFRVSTELAVQGWATQNCTGQEFTWGSAIQLRPEEA